MEANGKLCLIDDGKVTIKKPDFSADPKLDTVFGATILELDADLDARNQYKSFKAMHRGGKEVVCNNMIDIIYCIAAQCNGGNCTGLPFRD